MKKYKITVAALLLAGCALSFQSCIGSFSLTNSVLKWNKGIGKKFVNELVFVAFWVLPVYEVTGLADLLILNSIEFWNGENLVANTTKYIDTEHGRYKVDCDGKGYTITCERTGESTRLEFEDDTWSLVIDGESHPFMTFIDDSHVKMITPEGDFRVVELSESGVMAYSEMIGNQQSI